MRYEVDSSGVPVLLVDSISEIIPEDANKIVVAGSHASQNVPRYALSIPLRGAVFNDAGLGKDQAGIASFGILSAGGLPAVAVSHDTARIGDAQDVYENGIISAANELATEIGAEPGMTVADFIALVDATRWLNKPAGPVQAGLSSDLGASRLGPDSDPAAHDASDPSASSSS